MVILFRKFLVVYVVFRLLVFLTHSGFLLVFLFRIQGFHLLGPKAPTFRISLPGVKIVLSLSLSLSMFPFFHSLGSSFCCLFCYSLGVVFG